MSSYTPPVAGQDPWDADLNATLDYLNEQINNFAAMIGPIQVHLGQLDTSVNDLQTRVGALESRPEYLYNSAPWQFSNAAPPATGSQLRLDNTNPSLATLIDMRLIDSDGADRTPWIRASGTAGSRLQLTDWDNAANTHRFLVTGTPTIGATNAEVPVSWVSGTGVIPNAKINVGFLVVLM
jgi:hypothetical protein